MRWMISCREATELASRRLDGAISLRERMRLGLHLLVCAACRAAERQMRRLRELARSTRTHLPTRLPEAQRRRILEAMQRAHDNKKA